MNVQVHYQGLNHTPWMDQFISHRVDGLNRYLGPAASINVNVRQQNQAYVTSLAIHHFHHDFSFSGVGDNLFASFTSAVSKARRVLQEHKRKIKDRIHRRHPYL